MPLRKSPVRTPALLAALRRNAQKSTGPRTARGKANVRLNALREGGRSRLYQDFNIALLTAPLGKTEHVIRAMLTPDLACHPKFALCARIARWAERPTEVHFRLMLKEGKREYNFIRSKLECL